jgi:catechol 2,3-dioxygenase-like lactoylglutathione lyase family enzyme
VQPIIHHVRVTVVDLDRAAAFYDRLMPLLGFRRRTRASIASHEFEVIEYSHPRLAFAINSPRASVAGDAVHRRRPGSLHHLAFAADSREEVDRLHAALVDLGAHIVEPPRAYPEYVPPGY